MVLMDKVLRTIKTKAWCVLIVCAVAIVMEAAALNGDNVCMVKQKYNITKRVKYRAPMSVRTYEWCFSMPPRCSRWNTEMRDLTRLETEERIAEVAVCCPGYKMRDVSCVPICPNGKTGPGCSEDCPDNKWGPNCIHECNRCKKGFCSPITGECECLDGWQGESCDVSMPPTTATPSFEEILTALTTKIIPTTTRITSTVTTLRTTVTTPTTTTTTPRTTVTTPSTTLTTPTTIVTTPTTVVTTPTTVAITPTTVATTPTKVATTPTIVATTSSTPISTPTTTAAPTTKATLPTSASTKNVFTPTIVTLDTKENQNNEMITTFPKEIPKTVTDYVNTTIINTSTTKVTKPTTEAVTEKVKIHPINVKTDKLETTTEPIIAIKTAPTAHAKPKPIEVLTTTEMPTTVSLTTVETTIKMETSKKETTVKFLPTTIKFKPKEIWIRPAQKEPEHITAVMGDKGSERSSVDLISVISIAGGVMMAVITVAVVIVMIERCKKPRYEDVRKINDIRMQVMIDNNDVPPPYVRSIFHTPLPDPPSSEKCHYQPISTLDRNLKQFMRPVVVQTISPIMLENFRGILECHYDHLPRRSHEFNTIQTRSSIAPSMNDCSELRQLRASVTESTIEALKCEAKLDVIDSTTSEPLYAEIPCWRPPSEHAIEIMNLNGEAVTEL